MGGLYIHKASADLITLGQIRRAFRGYSCVMKQAAKATALLLLVSLLSGCSSSQNPADKPVAKTECQIATEKSQELFNVADAELKANSSNVKSSALVWAFYTIEKGDCFSAEIVAKAKTIIALTK